MATTTTTTNNFTRHFPEGEIAGGDLLGGVFVYGTLRTGEALEGWLPKAKRTTAYVRGTLAYAPGRRFPVLLQQGKGYVKGEWISLSMNSKPARTTADMECSAGYSISATKLYVRRSGKMVATKNMAYVFVWPHEDHAGVIKSGDWLNREQPTPPKQKQSKPKQKQQPAKPKPAGRGDVVSRMLPDWWNEHDAETMAKASWPKRARTIAKYGTGPAASDPNAPTADDWAAFDAIEWDSTKAYTSGDDDWSEDAWECSVCGFYDEHDVECMDCGGDPIGGPRTTKAQRRGRM